MVNHGRSSRRCNSTACQLAKVSQLRGQVWSCMGSGFGWNNVNVRVTFGSSREDARASPSREATTALHPRHSQEEPNPGLNVNNIINKKKILIEIKF